MALAKVNRQHSRDKTSSAAQARAAFIEKTCKSNISEEWKKPDNRKIAKLRGILKALQEENQASQLLKHESMDAAAVEALAATREDHDARLAVCKEKQRVYEQKESDLRRRVLENAKSLQELEETIEKDEKKARESQAECKRFDNEIKELSDMLAEEEKSKNLEKKKIALTSQYRGFLEAVAQECEDDFEGDVEVLINRHRTLEAGNQELHQENNDRTRRLDSLREKCMRVQTELHNQHLMNSRDLHNCQQTLELREKEREELEQRLKRALQEKELSERKIGVIHMAVEQLFTRTLTTCQDQQRRDLMQKEVDTKLGPVRGDKSDVRLDAMLRQIAERMEDLSKILRDFEVYRDEQLGSSPQVSRNYADGTGPPTITVSYGTDHADMLRQQAENAGSDSLAAGASSLRQVRSEASGQTGTSAGSSGVV